MTKLVRPFNTVSKASWTSASVGVAILLVASSRMHRAVYLVQGRLIAPGKCESR